MIQTKSALCSIYSLSAYITPLIKLRFTISSSDYLFLSEVERKQGFTPHSRSPLSPYFLSVELCDVGRKRTGFSGLETRIALFRNDVAASRRRKRDRASWRTRVCLSVRRCMKGTGGCTRTLRDTRIHGTPSIRARLAKLSSLETYQRINGDGSC